MSFAELVLFVDGVGYSLAARSRDEMFIKKQCILWYLLLKIIFRLLKFAIFCRFKNKKSAMLGYFSLGKTAILCKVAPHQKNCYPAEPRCGAVVDALWRGGGRVPARRRWIRQILKFKFPVLKFQFKKCHVSTRFT